MLNKETALNTILGWLDTWATRDNIEFIGHIRVGGRNTYIDMQDPGGHGEQTVINIATDELRAFTEHPQEFEPTMKWVIAHEYGHHRGWKTDSGLDDPLNWTSDKAQDYADTFAAEVTGLTRTQAREATHRLAPKVIWRDGTPARRKAAKKRRSTKTLTSLKGIK